MYAMRVIYDPQYLVYNLNDLGDQSFFEDIVPNWPLLNQQLATLMIVDGNFIRYPGAILTDATAPTGFTVGIPLVTSRAADGVETIRWIPIVEEIEPSDVNDRRHDPFSIASDQRGIVALRINYPFQSASMSSFRHDPNAADFPFEPTVGRPNAADDDAVTENPDNRPGALTGAPLLNGNVYAGTYGGQFGLGAQGALGSATLTGSRPVRPYRRIISAQAIYRRGV